MTKITILGAGITGMMTAGKLARDYDITIVAEHLPGDYHTKEWASPWAGAIWVGVHQSDPREQKIVRQIEMTEIMDKGVPSEVWYAGKVPNFRFMSRNELPDRAIYGMKYTTAVLTPQKFLVWLQERLVAQGVKFLSARVTSLADLKGLGHDVLINASGFGAEKLRDVGEKNLTTWRLQCVVAKAENYNRLFIRRGPNGYYSTAFSRMDGTVYCGGVLTENDSDTTVSEEQRATICRNAHLNQPDVFPSPDPTDWPILYDHVGLYPTLKEGGVRCEKEIVADQRVIHAYGQNAGGYVYSFGLARAVVNLVDDYLQVMPRIDPKL